MLAQFVTEVVFVGALVAIFMKRRMPVQGGRHRFKNEVHQWTVYGMTERFAAELKSWNEEDNEQALSGTELQGAADFPERREGGKRLDSALPKKFGAGVGQGSAQERHELPAGAAANPYATGWAVWHLSRTADRNLPEAPDFFTADDLIRNLSLVDA